jgi:hypothetical protein
MTPHCLACRWIQQPLSKQSTCQLSNMPICDPFNSFCRLIVSDIEPASSKFISDHQIEDDNFYIWVEVDGQRDYVALASIETLKAWTHAEQCTMRAKRAQLHEYFKRTKF